MNYFLVVSIALAVAIIINCLGVYVQRRHAFYDRFGHGWFVHSLVISPSWALFVILASRLHDRTVANFHSIKWLGLAVSGVAIAMFVSAILKVGTQALSNGNFFGKGKITNGGIYHYLNNPIYDSYWILLVGTGLYWGNWAYFLLAVECYIGLNIIEAYVERPDSPLSAVRKHNKV